MQETITGLLVLNGPVYMCIYLVPRVAWLSTNWTGTHTNTKGLESIRGDREEIHIKGRDSWLD